MTIWNTLCFSIRTVLEGISGFILKVPCTLLKLFNVSLILIVDVVYFIHKYLLLFCESITCVTCQGLNLLCFLLEVCLDLEFKVFNYLLELVDVFISIGDVQLQAFLSMLNVVLFGLKRESFFFELLFLISELSNFCSQAINFALLTVLILNSLEQILCLFQRVLGI